MQRTLNYCLISKLPIQRVLLLNIKRHFSYPPHVLVGMPALSPTMTAGTIGKWLKKEGEVVKPGDVFCEVETDKASVAFEAQEDAIVAKLLVNSGSEVTVGAPILITVEDESYVSAFSNFVLDKVESPKVETKVESKQATISKPTPVASPSPVATPQAPIPPKPIVNDTPAPAPIASVAVIENTKINTKAEVSVSSTQHPPALSYAWGTGVSKSPLSNKLSKAQEDYIAKYGRSGHQPIKI